MGNRLFSNATNITNTLVVPTQNLDWCCDITYCEYFVHISLWLRIRTLVLLAANSAEVLTLSALEKTTQMCRIVGAKS